MANLLQGSDNIGIALIETGATIVYGAHAVDVVFSYCMLIVGNEQVDFKLIKQCKQVCQTGNVLLKVIIESRKLQQSTLIRKASEIAINASANFINLHWQDIG